MNLEKLISKGYFPKELPPPFNTELLGNKVNAIINHFNSFDTKTKNKYRETHNVFFSTPKVGLSRRILGIPNPIHQIELSDIIIKNWTSIEKIFSESKISSSKPIEDDSNDRALKTICEFGEFREKCFEISFNKSFELKTDISKYYPTIYTHSIPWALHTKKVAKKKRFDFTLLGNLIDKAIRSGQSGQTKGIPIGPDTSRVISEILGCTFDKFLSDKFSIKGYRFVDDCYFYFSSYSDAEKLFKYFQSILTDFSLDINEEKTCIKQLPYPFETAWVIALSNFRIRTNKKGQRTDLKNYISLAFEMLVTYPKDSIMKFTIRKLYYSKIYKENWTLFESLILKIGISEPVTLPHILRILLTYKKWVNKNRLKEFVNEIIRQHIYKGHHYEVSWALWIAHSFSIKINKPLAQQILDSKDVISIIIALDLKSRGLIVDTIDLSEILIEINIDSLITEWWLLVYESVKKGWIIPADRNLIEKSEYFKKLKDENIEFYDNTRQIEKITFEKEKEYLKKNQEERAEYKFIVIEYN
ncbi:RNA-directed DNA polymerase [bacterium]|nr:RNA-directed DNA polymerase [bacterium]MBU1994772.1 RNA-directed DNA polymerase [bacterium]